MNKIRQGDEIIVLTGKDKGRRGTVLQIFKDRRVLVEGINVSKKHTKPNPNAGIEGGILDKEMPIDASNVIELEQDTNITGDADVSGTLTVGTFAPSALTLLRKSCLDVGIMGLKVGPNDSASAFTSSILF